jgi:hypothetical protein
MKKIFIIAMSAFMMLTAQAQKTPAVQSHLLKHYFELKDALVNSDAATASHIK